MIKVGDKVRVTGEDPDTRTFLYPDKLTMPLGTVVTVKRITSDGDDAYWFDWEGAERGVYARYTTPVGECSCSPSTLLLLGCTCSE